MRIIGGTFRGRKLTAIGKGDPGAHLRPTTDRVRESLFNLLVNGGYGDPIGGARVLDAFAGTGALGLEALSRGAERLSLIETSPVALKILRGNIALLGVAAQCRVLALDATRPPAPPHPHDLAFLDPPYGQGLGTRGLGALSAGGWLAPGALAVVEDSAAIPAPQDFERLDQRRYGDSWITILRLAPPAHMC